jgi:hypothetical protein
MPHSFPIKALEDEIVSFRDDMAEVEAMIAQVGSWPGFYETVFPTVNESDALLEQVMAEMAARDALLEQVMAEMGARRRS